MSLLRMNWALTAEIEYEAFVDTEVARKALADYLEWEPESAAEMTADELSEVALAHADALDVVLADLEADAPEVDFGVFERRVVTARPVLRPVPSADKSVAQGEAVA
ncbi:hypothetical protein [Amycolatopsis minnesotensis]|uniref:Uncharacterized protein n=1 Tax=Amycolatopsis minnesotensis TaxID=337894 RepID=A0ABN2Q170_9PSEU